MSKDRFVGDSFDDEFEIVEEAEEDGDAEESEQ